jgi:signal transduction histidine kinase
VSAYPPITHRLLAKKLFPGTRRRFLLRLARVSPQLHKIQAAWRALLADLALTADAEKSLYRLDVEKLYRYLRAGDWHAYESALERLGKDLAGCNVPQEYAGAALGLFFEICLCSVLGETREDAEQALGLARLSSVSQLFLASGYANHRALSIGALHERLKQAEKRAEALAISASEANEKERHRFASDLHDEIGHDLVVLKFYLEMIAADVREKVNGDVCKQLAEAINLSTRAIEAVRRLAFDLGPVNFDECGFVPAIRNYVRRFTATTGVKARVRVSLSSAQFHAGDELALYRVLQGALSNVLKHSRAKTVSIAVKSDLSSLSMSVEDDGAGFNVARKLRDSRNSFGLQAMRERIELLGGKFQIHSPAAQTGKRHYGTRIEVVLPLTRRETK